MRRFIWRSAAFAALLGSFISSGLAAEYGPPLYPPPPPLDKSPLPPVPIITDLWTGCYLGVNAGGAFTNDTYTTNWVSGALLGGTVGCNYQAAPYLLIGVELQSDWAAAAQTTNVSTGAQSQIKSVTDAAVRLGVPVDRLLLFVKA
jgi:hypothetical protein